MVIIIIKSFFPWRSIKMAINQDYNTKCRTGVTIFFLIRLSTIYKTLKHIKYIRQVGVARSSSGSQVTFPRQRTPEQKKWKKQSWGIFFHSPQFKVVDIDGNAYSFQFISDLNVAEPIQRVYFQIACESEVLNQNHHFFRFLQIFSVYERWMLRIKYVNWTKIV